MASLKEVRDYFGMTVSEFREEWTKQGLTDSDKASIRQGIGDGTLTY